jgi:hypothetical protein
MNSDNSAVSRIWVLTIHDKVPGKEYLSFDMEDVLRCLASSIQDYIWVITDLNCTGEEAQWLCDASERSRLDRKAVVLSWSELLESSQKWGQTLDATIIGTRQESLTPETLEAINDLVLFANSPAEVIIRAIDTSYFEVITKHYDQVESLKKCFRDVREEDPQHYFAASADR